MNTNDARLLNSCLFALLSRKVCAGFGNFVLLSLILLLPLPLGCGQRPRWVHSSLNWLPCLSNQAAPIASATQSGTPPDHPAKDDILAALPPARGGPFGPNTIGRNCHR